MLYTAINPEFTVYMAKLWVEGVNTIKEGRAAPVDYSEEYVVVFDVEQIVNPATV